MCRLEDDPLASCNSMAQHARKPVDGLGHDLPRRNVRESAQARHDISVELVSRVPPFTEAGRSPESAAVRANQGRIAAFHYVALRLGWLTGGTREHWGLMIPYP